MATQKITEQAPADLPEVGEVAWLKIVEVNKLGAFADWGRPKDLFIPYAEQQQPLRAGLHALLTIYRDNQGRPAGSTRLDHWLPDRSDSLREGQRVSLLIADQTELGFKAVVDHECWGLLYKNELYRRVRRGQTLDGYVLRIREDGKVDLSLTPPGFSQDRVDDVGQRILDALRDNGGTLALTDKSPPQEIYRAFAVSKRVFKQALGALYKRRLVALEPEGIRLL